MNRTSILEKDQKDSPSKSTLGPLAPKKEQSITMYADKGDSIKTGLHIESDDNISRAKNFDKTKSLTKEQAVNNGEASHTYLSMAINDIQKSQKALQKIRLAQIKAQSPKNQKNNRIIL